PLFANRITFMTTFAEPGSYGDQPPLTVVQAPPGILANVPSARSFNHPLPHSQGTTLRRGPDHDAAGRPLWLGTPSPCPSSHVLPPGQTVAAGAGPPGPGAYGLYIARDDWPESSQPADADQIDLTLLFDDPEMVDAEPVAVYERKFALHDGNPEKSSATPPT